MARGTLNQLRTKKLPELEPQKQQRPSLQFIGGTADPPSVPVLTRPFRTRNNPQEQFLPGENYFLSSNKEVRHPQNLNPRLCLSTNTMCRACRSEISLISLDILSTLVIISLHYSHSSGVRTFLMGFVCIQLIRTLGIFLCAGDNSHSFMKHSKNAASHWGSICQAENYLFVHKKLSKLFMTVTL